MAYLRYWFAMIRYAIVGGSKAYYMWLAILLGGLGVGGYAYYNQLVHGLSVTNLSDQVSWGAYIANFTFLVGVAAAAVLLVVPSYVYKRDDIKEVVLVGELLAVAAIVMCLAFVGVDIGRPERALHMVPGIGRLNFPRSILAWDVVVLNGYLLLNLHIPGYLLYKRWKGEKPITLYYMPLVFLSIGWAISIHTFTAFLYSGLGGRPFWNSAILAPRFLVSAFTAGPALLILVFMVISHFKLWDVKKSVTDTLRKIVCYTLPLNLFLLGCEVFKEFYTDSTHVASAEYLFFGLHGSSLLKPYIWSALAMEVLALAIFLAPSMRKRMGIMIAACIFCVVGIWIEKGMGLIVPGFIPTPAGDLVEYTPSVSEIMICLGIWSLGTLIFTLCVRVALAIQSGTLRAPEASA